MFKEVGNQPSKFPSSSSIGSACTKSAPLFGGEEGGRLFFCGEEMPLGISEMF